MILTADAQYVRTQLSALRSSPETSAIRENVPVTTHAPLGHRYKAFGIRDGGGRFDPMERTVFQLIRSFPLTHGVVHSPNVIIAISREVALYRSTHKGVLRRRPPTAYAYVLSVAGGNPP
jgi:hypothetical protein